MNETGSLLRTIIGLFAGILAIHGLHLNGDVLVTNDMSEKSLYKTVEEIIAIAEDRRREDEASSLPIPKKSGPELVVVLFIFNAGAAKGQWVVSPPREVMELDPRMGAVLNVTKVTPQYFGIDHPTNVSLSEKEIKPGGGGEYRKKLERFKELSPLIWEFYAAGHIGADPKSKAFVIEYRSLFRDVAKEYFIPYYKALSPDFFRWLEDASR